MLTTPVVRNLIERFPECQIDFVLKSRYVDIYKHNPNIYRIYTLEEDSKNSFLKICREMRKEKYSLVLDLHRNIKTFLLTLCSKKEKSTYYRKPRIKRWMLIVFKKDLYQKAKSITQFYLKPLKKYGVDQNNLCHEIYIDRETQKNVDNLFEENGIGLSEDIVAFAPGAGKPTKEWPLEYFNKLGKKITENYKVKIAVLGSKKDVDKGKTLENETKTNVVSFAGKTTLLESAEIIRRSKMIVVNDSGMMHISQALNVPTISIFGPTVQEFGFFPKNDKSIVVEEDIYCRPCSPYGTNSCIEKHFKCMKNITAERVYKICERFLKSNSTSN